MSNNKLLFQSLKKYKNSALIGFTIGIMLPILGGVLINSFSVSKHRNYSFYPVPKWMTNVHQNFIRDDLNSSVYSQDRPTVTAGIKDESLPLEFVDAPAINTSRFTVLLIGTDNRPGEAAISNTDTLIVTSVDKSTGRIALLSVPRDTQVNIPSWGLDKINSAARTGKGINTTVYVVEQLIGERIDGYIITNFNGFKQMVDTIGGVTVNVEKDMYYNTGDRRDGIINLKKGSQRLNGAKALQYARFRNDSLADISRTARQQTVLKAMVKEVIQVKNIPKLPILIGQIYTNIETDLSVSQFWSLSKLLMQKNEVQIVAQTLPGRFAIEKGISYWKVNPRESRVATKKLFDEGKTTSVFSGLNSKE